MALPLPAIDTTEAKKLPTQVTMHKMPRIWTQYLELLMGRRAVTRARRTFDRALQALPITQHDRVWVLYLVSGTVGDC